VSSEQLMSFLSAVKQDDVLRERWQELGSVDAIITFASELGFSVETSDVESLLDASTLDDDDLAGVSGGWVDRAALDAEFADLGSPFVWDGSSPLW